jgi:cystathionine beta-lyase
MLKEKMNLFDFDTVVERCGTASLKWEKYKDRDIIPLWVADMDFRSPPAVIRALKQRVECGVFGYTVTPDELTETVIARLRSRYDWRVHPEWLIWLPGLVTGLNVACRAVGKAGDDVMTAVPIYPPFLSAPGYSDRNIVKVEMHEEYNHWRFDFDRLENSITRETRLFLLCSPHNPVGRVFSFEELNTLAEICLKHDIVICSDEIHCDLILDDQKSHIPTATLNPDVAARTITLMSPSKTFNLPGLSCAFAVIPDKGLRRSFKQAMAGIVPRVNAAGLTAALAAFSECDDWHAALLDYLRGNLGIVERAVNQMPDLSIAPVEATYLAWIDMRATGLENPPAVLEKAGVGLQDGVEFDAPGFMRLNFGCPRSLLEEALQRIDRAMIKER